MIADKIRPMTTAAEPVRVMVVDDSAIVRGLIGRQLQLDPNVKVVASAANGEIALRELARQDVDVVVLDIEMPVLDGIAALPRMLEMKPGVKVVMASSLTRRNAEISLKALQLGASDYIAKPEAGLGGAEEFQRELLEKVLALGRPKAAIVRAPVAPQGPSTRRSPFVRPSVLGIGSSTGGPPALVKLFEAMAGAVEQPILLTQHMPATFTALLAEQLTRAGKRPCAEAVDGEPIIPGRCYVAPGGWHMLAASDKGRPIIRLNQEPPENFCRPAVDPMFRSLVAVYGPAVLGIILTGMGSDGAKGCVAVSEAGGRFIVQDEASSVVWGMPGAAAGTGLAERVLPLAEIGPWTRLKMAAPQ